MDSTRREVATDQLKKSVLVTQIQGHTSATAGKHYTVRTLELLALHHERIEAWILKQAGIVFDSAQPETSKLRAVAA